MRPGLGGGVGREVVKKRKVTSTSKSLEVVQLGIHRFLHRRVEARPLAEAPLLGEGVVEAELPELSAGEHQVIVLVEAHVGGDYFWPASRVNKEGELAASTVSGRVVIDWE